MYDKRIKIFIGISLTLLLVCMLRLMQMQLLADSSLQAEIDRLKERRGLSKQLKTLRGNILDRNGEIVAADTPRFQVHLNYRLSCFLDDRVVQTRLAEAEQDDADPSLDEVRKEVDDRRQDLEQVIAKCSQFGLNREQMEEKIRGFNDAIWDYRSFIAWVRGGVDPNLVTKYGGVNSIPTSEALTELEHRLPDPDERHRRIARVDDIPEMQKDLPLVELETAEDVFTAQFEFMEMNDVEILPTGHRYYPYGSAAAQTIGWVGPATQERDTRLFADDPLARYLPGEVCGREDGVEYVCEKILRGRRGELVYDIDRQLVRQTETQFGQDVQVTLDIRLQKRIEEHLTEPQVNPGYHDANMAAVVIQIRSGDILALVSLPTYDLNRARYDYDKLLSDLNGPLINRTIYRLYPPGSVVKPLTLIAGLETGVTTPEKIIHCPAAPAPAGWPDCWIYRQYRAGHDGNWDNHARNAIKGSCNIYFSRLADEIEPRLLQQWLFKFGYGQPIPLTCPGPSSADWEPAEFRQAPGQIGSKPVPAQARIESLEQIPPLWDSHRKLFGIGHGNFRVTPLQVADTFATLARGGRRKTAHLFLHPSPTPESTEPVDLQISHASLQVIYDGMSAVVNEPGGTAYQDFGPAGLARQGVKVYGKTGSTERPENAWFAGFAEDAEGAKIAVAVVIEGGQHGSRDAAPLAREIIQLCVEAGYVGRRAPMPITR